MSEFDPLGRSSFKLNGFFGEFATPDSNYKIKFFSTVGNGNSKGNEKSYKKFLEKLEPLREKINPSSIDDLGTLLQRDINDIRIANDILPYLVNRQYDRINPNHIAFFPSVLCVLMPPKFLLSNTNNISDKKNYPTPQIVFEDENKQVVEYGNSWKLMLYKDSLGINRFSQIEIFDEEADFLVLDGQHRTNAFRAAMQMFPRTGTIYESFYSSFQPPSNFNADLPVTLIWFESIGEEIKPSLISRKLFVDVNQSSERISNSRLVLLRDNKPNNLLTRFFYTFLGTNYRYRLDVVSLFHFAFDFDSNISDKKATFCPLSLFVPEIIDHTIDWLFFSNPNSAYTLGKKYVNRVENCNFDYFESYFDTIASNYFEKTSDEFGDDLKITKTDINIESLKSECFRSGIFNVIYDLYSNFPFIKKHVEATSDIYNEYLNNEGIFRQDNIMKTAFEKAILGGESLFYAIQRLGKESNNRYWDALNKNNPNDKGIIATFKEKRLSYFTNQDQEKVDFIFKRMNTVVFSTGYIMAFSHFYNTNNYGSLFEAKDNFIERINSIDENRWICFFNEFWKIYFGENDTAPKFWPLISNMILRMIQEPSEFFDSNSIRQKSPEFTIFIDLFQKKLEAYRIDELKRPKWDGVVRTQQMDNDVNQIIIDCSAVVNNIFQNLGLIIDQQIDYSDICFNNYYLLKFSRQSN
jgi:hypothetical protein